MPEKVCSIVIIFLLLQLCGCWDSRDLDKLTFPLAAAYDVHSPGSSDPSDPPAKPGQKQLDVTALLPNLAPKVKEPVNVETLSGVNLADIRQRRGLTDADIYATGMVQTLIAGEELARRGLNQDFDALRRSTSITGTIYFAVAAGRGEDILKTPTKNYTNIASFLIGLFQGVQQRTFIPVTTLNDFFVQGKGQNPVAPILERKGDRVIITGVAVFKKDRMIKKLTIEDGHDLVLLRGNKGRSYQPFSFKQGEMTSRGAVLVSNSRKVKYYHNQQGHNFLITIKLNGSLGEHNQQSPVTEKQLQDIETGVEKQLTTQCQKFIKKMQNEIKVDCIDISKYALAKHRRALEKEIDKPEFIENANIKVKVKVHLEDTGETS